MMPNERDMVKQTLAALGIHPGDCLFVHSSFKRLGLTHLAPADVVDTLKAYIGPSGSIGMPTFTYSSSPDKPFQCKEGSCASITGIIPETFRTSSDVVRSASPSHSCAFWGREADYCAAPHGGLRPYALNGPFGKLYELGFKIVMLGCGVGCNSTLHAIEDWAELPYVRGGTQRCYREEDVPEGRLYTHMPIGHRDYYRGEASKVFRQLDECGLVGRGAVGSGSAFVMPVRELVDTCMEALDRDPAFFLCDDPVCVSCRVNQGDLGNWRRDGGTLWSQIWVGAHKTDITPVVGSLCNQGWGSGVPCEGVKTPLHARALVLKRRHEFFAVVSLDVVRNNRAEALEQAIAAKAHIPADHILVSCTHTHTGPAVGRDTFKQGNAVTDEVYLPFLHARIAVAVHEAKQALRPAFWATAREEVDIGNINRNVRLPDGSLRYFDGTPECPEPNGPVSRTFSMGFIKDRRGKLIAGLGHYACHPIFSPKDARLICGDYPGYFSNGCEQALGCDCVVCFLQGALGNQMPRHYDSAYEQAETAGKKLAYTFLRWGREAKADPLRELRVAKRPYAVRRTDTPFTIGLGALTLNYSLFGYGGGELFSELADRFEEKAGKGALWVGLSNDMMYLPSREAFESGQYEVRMCHRVMGGRPGIGEEIVDACADLFTERD